MARGWVRDISWEILLDANGNKDHWTSNPPVSVVVPHPQYRRCISYNIAINMFGSGATATTFHEYYESPISKAFLKFRFNSQLRFPSQMRTKTRKKRY